jgi:hypothetical protein
MTVIMVCCRLSESFYVEGTILIVENWCSANSQRNPTQSSSVPKGRIAKGFNTRLAQGKKSKGEGLAKRGVYFFEEPGERNTGDVIKAVAARVKEGGVEAIVVASASGGTALRIAERLRAQRLGVKVVCVSGPPTWKRDAPQYKFPLIEDRQRRKLQALRVKIVDQADEPFKPIVFRDWWERKTLTIPRPESDLFWATLICVGGHGFRTAVEVVFMAVDAGAVRPGQRVIGVGGTNRGLDSAIVLEACRFSDAVGRSPSSRLKVEEILAMPKQTTWKGYG